MNKVLCIALCVAFTAAAESVINSNVRIVQGKEYSVWNDPAWVTLKGKVEGVEKDGLIIRLYKPQPITQEERRVIEAKARKEHIKAADVRLSARAMVPAESVFLRGAPARTVGGDFTDKGLPAGGRLWCGTNIAAFEYGQPTVTTVQSSARQDHQLGANQAAAAKGDPEALLRMAERYHLGNGVPKDMAKARELYEKAAALGNADAKAALKYLK